MDALSSDPAVVTPIIRACSKSLSAMTCLASIIVFSALYASASQAQTPFTKPTRGWAPNGDLVCNCTVDTGAPPTTTCGALPARIETENACNEGITCREACKNTCADEDIGDFDDDWHCSKVETAD